MQKELYEALGGEPGIAALVESAFAEILADDLLKIYFFGSDIENTKRGVASFLAGHLRGETAGLPVLHKAHGGLQINDEAFDLWVGSFERALGTAGASEQTRNAFLRFLGTWRNRVVEGFNPSGAFVYAKD
jgi:truncated hemoglobin YjbI